MRIYSQLLSEAMNAYEDKLFTFPYDMAEEYKPVFEHKFLLRFGYRNIGFDSYAMFKRMVELTMSEVLPRYLKLYESETVDLNPFVNTRLKSTNFNRNNKRRKAYETANHQNVGSSSSSSTDVDSSQHGVTTGGSEGSIGSRQSVGKHYGLDTSGFTNLKVNSDTPQTNLGDSSTATATATGTDGGESSKYFNDGFITDVNKEQESRTSLDSHVDDDKSLDASERSHTAFTKEGAESNRVSQGKNANSGQSYSDSEHVESEQDSSVGDDYREGLSNVLMSDALIKWRSTFINIDSQLLDEFNDLFIGVF